MRIAVAADHAGYLLRREVIEALREDSHDVLDLGTDGPEQTDYPDAARDVAQALLRGDAERGVLICGSGAGVSVAANKFRGVRAAACHDAYTAHQCVEHDDVNVLCMGSRVVGVALALDLVRAWVNARFTGEERHRRRLRKIETIEAEQMRG